MFEKSLLEILTKEKDIIKSLENLKDLEADFLKMAENETAENTIKSCNRLLSSCKEKIEKKEKELLLIRKEIKRYFLSLENL